MDRQFLASQLDYLKIEIDKLNGELQNHLEETRSREKYSLTIIGGVAVWVFTNLDEAGRTILLAVCFVPVVTTITYGLSVLFIYRNIKWIGEYLRRIEDYLLTVPGQDKGGFGWEEYLDTKNRKKQFVRMTYGIWIFQIFLTIALVFFVMNYNSGL